MNLTLGCKLKFDTRWNVLEPGFNSVITIAKVISVLCPDFGVVKISLTAKCRDTAMPITFLFSFLRR